MSEEVTRASRNASKRGQKKRKVPRGNKKKGFGHYAKLTLLTLVTIGAVGLLAGAGLFAYYASSAPKVTNAALVGTQQSEILDTKGDVVWTSGTQDRKIAAQSEIPSILKKSVVSIEDRRFYQHGGVDLQGIAGAALGDLTGSSLGMRGGSTLTQQLVKLTVFSTAASDQTLRRKAQEAWLAVRLEKKYSKNQILTMYINKVYMGNGVYGMKTAAEYYYGKSMDQLSVPQIALLAGLPQSPSGYDPYTNPTGATQRRNTVLAAMAETGAISKSNAKTYAATSINDGLLTEHPAAEQTAKLAKVSDAYLTSTIAELKKKGYDLGNDGIIVHTNLDIDIQQKAYDLANSDDSPLYWMDDEVQIGATVLNPNNGKVVAQIGGRKQDTTFGLNRATQTTRSSGSTAKPIVDYAPAIENLNWPTYRGVDDSPYTYAGTDIQVYDADHLNKGYITMRQALVESRNIPAIRTLQAVGNSKATTFLGKLGIKLDSALKPASAIGINVSTEQQAAAYAAFDNGGTYYKPQYVSSIDERNGETKKFDNPGTTAMKSSTAFMMTSMLQSYVSDSYAKFINTSSYAQGGKTGTVNYDSNVSVPTNAVSDSWFTGFTKAMSISVWTGYDSPNDPGNYLAQTASASSPQYLSLYFYKNLMQYIMTDSNRDGSSWSMPSTVDKVTKYGNTEYEVKDAKFTDPGITSSKTTSSSATTSSTLTSSVIASSSSSSSSSVASTFTGTSGTNTTTESPNSDSSSATTTTNAQ